MRRFGAAVVAAVVLLAASAVPASAQDLGDVDVLELPQMGFAISRDAGFPGDVVTGQVDVDDVAEDCLSVDELVGNVVNSVDDSLGEWSQMPPPAGLSEEQVQTFANAVQTLRIGVQVFEETAMQLWLETFVFTFADAVTQELLGETGNFDPTTGEGSVVVPQVAPGVYGLAAACVGLQSAEQLLAGGYDAGLLAFWDWIDENDIEVPENQDPVDEEWQAFVEESALEWVPEMITPRAVGIGVFCVLTPDGLCGDEPVEEDAVLDDPVTPPVQDLEPPAAAAAVVQTRPTFTG